jgi:hypothetical protein
MGGITVAQPMQGYGLAYFCFSKRLYQYACQAFFAISSGFILPFK